MALLVRKMSLQCENNYKSQRSALHFKDKFTTSNDAYHELSMVSNLPSSHQIKKLTKTLNSKFNIRSCPNGIIGVQQSLKSRIIRRLTVFIQRTSKEGVTLSDTINRRWNAYSLRTQHCKCCFHNY